MNRYVIIAGVNGAGKSTLYSLNSSWADLEKINLDETVREVGNWQNSKDIFVTGKIVVQKINECLAKEISFCQETTLCGKMILNNIRNAKEKGYFIEIHYVGLDSANLAKERVQHRVSVGGHGVDEKDIERRYTESLQNLCEIMGECDLVVFYDNTHSFRRFAISKNGKLKRIRAMVVVPKWYTSFGFDTVVSDYIVKLRNYEIVVECNDADYSAERLVEYHKLLMWHDWKTCEIMHGNDKVATMCKDGTCVIHNTGLVPYNLYLEEAGDKADIDVRMQNLENLYYWCASRTLPSDREYNREILNSINASHEETDKARAVRALWHNCLSLTDIYWTKAVHQKLHFSEINLYQNYKGNKYINTGLKGEQTAVENPYLLAGILGTQGYSAKAWIEEKGQLYLIKGGSDETIEKELLASKICRCFRVNQVVYEAGLYEGQKYSVCKIMTSPEYSIVTIEHFLIYLSNQEAEIAQAVFSLDAYNYYMMNIVDYLVGNIDRHWGNWGVMVDNRTNKAVRLHDLMDFNRTFGMYDTIEGANCLPAYLMEKKQQTQKEAAIEAVRKVGLNKIADVDELWFGDENVKKMFFERLRVLEAAIPNGELNRNYAHN